MFRYPRLPTFVGVGLLAALFIAALAFFAASSFGVRTADADPHTGQSVDVAVVSDPEFTNGGELPIGGVINSSVAGTLDFTAFNFTLVPVADVNATNLAAYDTVFLNVGDDEDFDCNVDALSASQKTDLANFVAGGNKLIIYDSECSSQDYSWLPYPFTTNNPGAQGAVGTLTIVEDNTLSHANAANAHYIDAADLATDTDAVGDMNVMTTLDPNWCLDMSGTNITPVTGPVHTYARYGAVGSVGLIIYNGLDIDWADADGGNDAGDWLLKIWLQELQQPFNPDNLPCEAPVAGISLTPDTATNDVGTDHTVTATVTDLLGDPVEGVEVTFEVTDGPNAAAEGTCSANADCTTDANGQVSFTYTGDGDISVKDTDTIKGCRAVEPAPLPPTASAAQLVDMEGACDTAEKTWEPAPTPTPTPTVAAEVEEPTPTVAAIPAAGGAPSDGGSSALPWLAAITGAIAVTSAGGFWFAYQRRRVR
jgi:hypothetical protein